MKSKIRELDAYEVNAAIAGGYLCTCFDDNYNNGVPFVSHDNFFSGKQCLAYCCNVKGIVFWSLYDASVCGWCDNERRLIREA